MTVCQKNKGGRPSSNTDLLAQKLEPYLKMGFSIRRACQSAGVNRSTIQKHLKIDEAFRIRLADYRNYKSILYGDIMLSKLVELFKEVEKARKLKLSLKTVLSKSDWNFLEFMARNDKSLKDEWGILNSNNNIPDSYENHYPFPMPKNNEEVELQTKVLNRHYEYARQNNSE